MSLFINVMFWAVSDCNGSLDMHGLRVSETAVTVSGVCTCITVGPSEVVCTGTGESAQSDVCAGRPILTWAATAGLRNSCIKKYITCKSMCY